MADEQQEIDRLTLGVDSAWASEVQRQAAEIAELKAEQKQYLERATCAERQRDEALAMLRRFLALLVEEMQRQVAEIAELKAALAEARLVLERVQYFPADDRPLPNACIWCGAARGECDERCQLKKALHPDAK